ncbi:P-type conjugative transfer protein TrbL [Rugamonas rivuli]|uniref:P-type conjugative transfer protein TrbL n=1 Tax=Rugamonas rivuli TaxID=2743358 RepID=A0A843SI40_9BURK|nr:P-type conjugative transfer protein TrbL [Rugamonas rivuli]MQA21664.1 P-type conjugative transfer protein TrbL [Rugamonas rivuli]
MEKLLCKNSVCPLLLFLMLVPIAAHATIETSDILDNVHDVYATAATAWAAVIKLHATRLFWTLALISMVWTFGMMALRSADVGEFFAEFVRFTIFTGFYWWLLDNGPAIAIAIIDSMRSIGGSASAGTHAYGYPLPSPSSIVDIGFDIFSKVVNNSSVWSPFASFVGVLISLVILLSLALMAVNILILLISAWVLAYAGIFFLGFGGSRWTSDMAISYFKTVLGVGAQLLVMVLLVGVGKTFIDTFYSRMSAGMKLNEMAAVMVVVVVMLALINKLPGLLAGLVSGGGTGALGSGFTAGSAVAAASMAAAAISTVGKAIGGAAANIAGGAQALMAAFEKGSAAESESSGLSQDFMSGQSGSEVQGGNTGESSFAQAMGGDAPSSGSSSADSSSQSTQQSGNSDTNGSGGTGSGSGGGGGGGGGGAAKSGASSSASGKGKNNSAGAKAVRIAGGATRSLVGGAFQVAKNSINDRVSNTIGGKIAAAIRESRKGGDGNSDTNTLSAGKNDDFDPQAEISAFRDRDGKDGDDSDPSKT